MHTMTYAEWYQTVEKPRLASITPAVREANRASHMIGSIDDVARCVRCEIAVWNAWQRDCNG